jgi:hypothetical protein
MRPARRIKQAEEVARRLKALLSSAIMSQLLQRTPPAASAFTAEQEAQLSSCGNVIRQLAAALDEAPSLKVELVDVMLKQQVACSVGSLVMWVQQQPEQLLDVKAAGQGRVPRTSVAGLIIASVWAAGVDLLKNLARVALLQTSESAGACILTATLTQQLDQSGKACSCTFDALCSSDVVTATRHACTYERITASVSRNDTWKHIPPT